ncbi:MAG: hypothetical protein J5529_13940 [Prevotella sp.]|nr:hypothetical protein [Prevotella sp.]
MNKYLLLSLLLFLLGVCSCENPHIAKLKKEVEQTNAYCPINGGISGDLLSVTYNQDLNDVKFYWSLNEEYGSLMLLKQNKEYIYSNMKLMLKNSESNAILKDLVAAKASLTLIYKTSSSGKTVTFNLSNEELEKIYNSPTITEKEIAQLRIANSVAIQNEACPQKIDEGMYIEKTEIVDDYLVYYCSMDESIYSINQMKSSISEMYRGVREYLKSTISDPSMKKDIENLITLKMGFQYRYYGKTTKNFIDVKITPEELKTYTR